MSERRERKRGIGVPRLLHDAPCIRRIQPWELHGHVTWIGGRGLLFNVWGQECRVQGSGSGFGGLGFGV